MLIKANPTPHIPLFVYQLLILYKSTMVYPLSTRPAQFHPPSNALDHSWVIFTFSADGSQLFKHGSRCSLPIIWKPLLRIDTADVNCNKNWCKANIKWLKLEHKVSGWVTLQNMNWSSQNQGKDEICAKCEAEDDQECPLESLNLYNVGIHHQKWN